MSANNDELVNVQKMMNLPHYLLSKGKREIKPPIVRGNGLKVRDTNVTTTSPPNGGQKGDGRVATNSTPANVKRKQVDKWFNSPTDILSPCSQKLWKRPIGEVVTVVAKLNLLEAVEEDEDEVTSGGKVDFSVASGESMDTE